MLWCVLTGGTPLLYSVCLLAVLYIVIVYWPCSFASSGMRSVPSCTRHTCTRHADACVQGYRGDLFTAIQNNIFTAIQHIA